MKARLIRIGNSRGIRIPQELVRLYNLREGAELELEKRQEGILVRAVESTDGVIPWDAAYQPILNQVAQKYATPAAGRVLAISLPRTGSRFTQ